MASLTAPAPASPADCFPNVCASAIETIGHTPLVALSRLCEGLPGLVLAKLEFYGPGASMKDRIARKMVEVAVASGDLYPGRPIVELTSGNTGLGLAVVAAVMGYRFYAVMSEGNSIERQRMLRAFGAEVVLVPQVHGYRPGIVTGEDLEKVEERAAELTVELNAWRPHQFGNPANVTAHEETTGREIWEQTGGRINAWVKCVGTGGSFLGVARALKQRNPEIRCYALEPAAARWLAGDRHVNPTHKLQGSGYNMTPSLWCPALCDGFVSCTDEDAAETARQLAAREGIFAGYSSGANVWAALQLAREAKEGEVIVTLCPDTGLKYLSGDLYP